MIRGIFTTKSLGWLAAIAALFVAVRAIYLSQLLSSPLLKWLFLDSEFYHYWGRMLVAGYGNPPGPFWLSPLYSHVLAAIFAGAGSNSTTLVVVLQFLLSLGTLLFLTLFVHHLFGQRVAIITAVLAAFYAPWLYYDGVIVTSSLILFLNSVLLWVLTVKTTLAPATGGDSRTLGSDQNRSILIWIGAGLLCGLSALARPSILLFAALLTLWVFLKQRPLRLLVVYFLLAAFLVTSPVLVRNLVVAGTPTLTTASGGVNFYIGNRAHASGMYDDLPFVLSSDPVREAEAYRAEASELEGDSLTLAQANRFWGQRALSEMARWPGQWVMLQFKKLYLTIQNYEIGTNLSLRGVAAYCPIVNALPVRWGLLFPLAAAGVFAAWAVWRRLTYLWLYVAAYVLTNLIFFCASEYRFPLILVLLPAAGCFLAALWQMIEEKNWKRLVISAWIYLIALALVNYPSREVRDRTSPATDFLNLATIAVDAGQFADAIPLFARALTVNDSLRDARVGLANCLWKLGNFDDARREYELAGLTAPDSLLGAPLDDFLEHLNTFVQNGDNEQAYRFLLQKFPEGTNPPPEVWSARARLERALQLPDAAMRSLLAAGRLEPDSPEWSYQAGQIARMAGRRALADTLLKESLRIYPAYAPSRVSLLELALQAGDTMTARLQIEELRQIRIPSDSVSARIDSLERQYLLLEANR